MRQRNQGRLPADELVPVALHILERSRDEALLERSPGRLRDVRAAADALLELPLGRRERHRVAAIRTAADANVRFVERGVALGAFATPGPEPDEAPDPELMRLLAAASTVRDGGTEVELERPAGYRRGRFGRVLRMTAGGLGAVAMLAGAGTALLVAVYFVLMIVLWSSAGGHD